MCRPQRRLTAPLPRSVGVFKNGRVEIIANDQGNRITPSYVAFTPEGERLIGDAAKNQLTSNPENTVFDAKRLIGRTWNDPSVQQDIKYLPFKVGPGRGGADGGRGPVCLGCRCCLPEEGEAAESRRPFE